MRMAKKYYVTLSDEEREYLNELIQRGKVAGYRIKHAQILLKLDEIPQNEGWSQEKIGEAYGTGIMTVSGIAKRYVLEGMEAALGRKEQENRYRKIDGDIEAKIVAIACSEAPEGRERWTLELIAQEVVRLGIMESLSHTAVADTLKKTNLSLGAKRSGAYLSRERNL